jgi:ABC-type multidrug transport system fused ATPase/permease subunit
LGRYLKCNTVANGLATSTELITTLVYVIFFAISIALLYGAGNEISYDCVLLASIYRGEELIISTYSLLIEFLVNLKSLRKCEELTKLEGEEGLELVKAEERESEEEPACHVDEGTFALAPIPFAFASNSIEFRGFSARYRGRSSNVLDRVSFKVAPGEKVGVVGRTGSGKSTLILCLMRAIARA